MSIWHCNTISRSLRKNDINFREDMDVAGRILIVHRLDEDYGIAPYRAQSREDVDCDCARCDGDASFVLLGSSSDS